MIKRMLTSAIVAGGVAGLFAALLHFAFLQDKILLAEHYEVGALVHFAGAPPAHGHDPAAAPEALAPVAAGADVAAGTGLQRTALTVAFSALIHVGYALILIAGFAVAALKGRQVTAREGALWGIAGFAAFQLAPAMGLAPELPGTLAADLAARQVWWWGTVAATATGLALIAFFGREAAVLLGIVLLAAPHVIGAPEPDGFFGTAPPELAAGFAASVLGVGLAVWSVLGALAGRLWSGSDPTVP